MSNSRPIRRPTASAKSSKSESGGKKKWVFGFFLLMLLAVGAWAMWPSQNPAMARIEALRVEMDNAPREKRGELFQQMREEFEKLSEEERESLFDERRREWQAREQRRLNEFFAMTPQEQIAHLDEEINEEEERRRQREARRAREAREGNRDRGGRGGDFRGRGSRGPRGPGSDPNARRKRYLEHTNATTRAQRGEYWRMRQERRRQRGLGESRWGR
ncbi:MAG: hypothetical protein DWQ37_01540 [Planctomycetota bacterium]|nr:MAG: hypothetical protein DWQ37_01540 [Planctomycetota bacterium]